MPLEGFLVKITRTDEYTWKTLDVLEVSFTDLVVPEKCDKIKVTKFRKLIHSYKFQINKLKLLLFSSSC